MRGLMRAGAVARGPRLPTGAAPCRVRAAPPPGRARAAAPALLAALLLATLPGGGWAQEADIRAAAVERGLSTLFQDRGKEAERFTLPDRMDHYRVPGVSVAVLDEGRIAWARGYGVADVETGEPVTPETLFQAASISKPVAALAALLLVQEGVLELDAPVNRYLGGWRIPENEHTARQPVTLRHLLTHTGGLTVHGFPGYAAGSPTPTVEEILDGAGNANTGPVRVDTLPGSLWRYSGGGYTILQKLLEDVTGQPFAQLLRERVLDPAGMSLSGYEQPLPPRLALHAATAHLRNRARVEGGWHLYPEMAAAGLWTNPTELARLALSLQRAYRGEPGGILPPDMARAMLTPGAGGWGLGFAVAGTGSEARFSHGGSNHGFKAQFWAYLEGGRGAVIMTNGERGGALAQEILLAVAREYGWPEPGYREVVLVELEPETLEAIAGSYRLPGRMGSLAVAVEGDHLRLEAEDGYTERFFSLSEGEFINMDDGSRIEVEWEGGEVRGLLLRGGLRATPLEETERSGAGAPGAGR